MMLPDIKKASLIVAHNIQFDRNVFLSELYRNDLIDEVKNI